MPTSGDLVQLNPDYHEVGVPTRRLPRIGRDHPLGPREGALVREPGDRRQFAGVVSKDGHGPHGQEHQRSREQTRSPSGT